MLERTAGCLETGSLRRLLPGAGEVIKTAHVVQYAQRSHGGGDLEAQRLWHASSVTQHVASSSKVENRSALSHNLNSVFLDSLSSLHALNSPRSYLPKQNRQENRFNRRYYTSSSSPDALTHVVDDTNVSYGKQPISDHEPLEEVESGYVSVAEAEKLRVLLHAGNAREDYEEAWRLFHLVPAQERGHFVSPLMLYLAKSSRPNDAERIISLFANIVASSTPLIRQAVLDAHVKLGDLSTATRLLEIFLENFACSIGCSGLFSRAIELHEWKLALRIYSAEARFRARGMNEATNLWTKVGNVPDLQRHALVLGRYILKRASTTDTADLSVSPAYTELRSMLENMIDKALVLSIETRVSHNSLPNLLEVLYALRIPLDERYELLIRRLIEMKDIHSASKCYHLYRKHISTGKRISAKLLRLYISESTSPNDIETALGDWGKYHGSIPSVVRKLALTQMSRHGDVKQVLNMAKLEEGQMTMDIFVPTIHAYAKRGQLSEVLAVWEMYITSGTLKPNVFCWNILINAYAKANDVEGALKRFYEMLKTKIAPDSVSFATIMQLCAKRGDFAKVTELYRLAETLGISRTPSMIDAVVLGHVKEDRLEQAEKICHHASKTHASASLTSTWNLILTAYAFQRNLKKTMALFQTMQDYKVPPDAYSYSALMQCFAMCKLPDRALLVLKDSMREANIKPNQFHYAIVMGGFLTTREPERTLKLHKRMVASGLKDTVSTKLMKLKAAVMLDQLERKTFITLGEKRELRLTRGEEVFREAVSTSKDVVLNELTDGRKKGLGPQSLEDMAPTAYYAFMMFTYGAYGAIDKVKELYHEYARLISEENRAEPPAKILSALISTNLRSRNYAGVQQCWEMVYASAKKNVSHNAELNRKTILQPHQYDLSIPLTFQIQSLGQQAKFAELMTLIVEVQSHGFVLDNKNLNTYCQVLAEGKQYNAAFEICENQLMSGFAGHARTRWTLPVRNRLSTEHRYWKKDAKNQRPLSHTLMFLGRALLDLEDGSVGSRLAQQEYEELIARYPKTVAACRSMQRDNSDVERSIFSRKVY